MILLLVTIALTLMGGTNMVYGQAPEGLYPLGSNTPRVNPDYCVGFHITYPTEYGKAFEYGEMTHITWEVDRNLTVEPDLITRIRILNHYQRNTQVIGENITIHTYENKGATTFPILIHDEVGLQHYRIMVNYPGKKVHCVYESVPFTVAPRTFERYTELDTPAPPFAVADAQSIKHHHEYRDYYM
ncbi:hypothetical protein BDA99DRAFT_492015 [Phascolomyces articulosus]|uniref:Uncharacterized protein n=1 Tax=Phascolomyces articulosus TaxID=60185 RepID=A0AAD5KBR0_9FUNG|nr:hypothetical protein BDA99DRAFT_492015 [Phascolomyces articulosus]